jgi:membrane fusion protein (multidrug efflux system)
MLMNHCACIHKEQHRLSNSPIYLLILFFLFLGYFILAYWLLVGQFYKKTEHAYVSGYLIKISPLIQGRITDILVNENELVVKGQAIATLDKANTYIRLKEAETNLSASIRNVMEIYQVTNELQSRAKTTLKNAENNLKKSQQTYKSYLDTEQKDAINKLKQAQIAVEKATDSFEEATIEYNDAMSLPINGDIYQNPIVTEAINQLRTAYLNWLESTVYAPETGYIVKRKILAGETVDAKTVLMTMVPLNKIWINASINGVNLRNIHSGQKVKLTSYIDKNNVIYEGIVIDSKPNSNAPSSIRILINPEQLAKYPLRLGLAMTATINTRNKNENNLRKIDNLPELVETNIYHDQVAADQFINQIVQDNTKNIIMPNTRLGSL